jgi:hypothetical protein
MQTTSVQWTYAVTQNIQVPLRSWNSSVNIVTWLQAVRPRNQSSNFGGGRNSTLHHNVQPSLGRHPDAFLMVSTVSSPGSKTAGTWSYCRALDIAKLHFTCRVRIQSSGQRVLRLLPSLPQDGTVLKGLEAAQSARNLPTRTSTRRQNRCTTT